MSPQQESSFCPADHDILFLLCRSCSAAGSTQSASSASRVQAAGLGSATQQQQPQVAQTKERDLRRTGPVRMCQGPPGALSADAPSSTWAASAPGSCCSLLPGWWCLAPGSHRSSGCGGMVLAPLQSGGSPCPCQGLAALTGAGASKRRRQCLLAWLLAGYFLSQYSQVSSCIFSKNLVLELALGVCGVSPAAESWRKVLDKWDVPVTAVHQREGRVQQRGCSLSSSSGLSFIPAGERHLQTSFPRGGIPARFRVK